MVISSFISSILVLALGVWAYMRLEPTMNSVAERQLLIEPSKFSYKMWKDMPVTMYQSFTFFNLTNWAQVKSVGQKPRFVEVGPYVYRTVWTKSDVNFQQDDKLVNFAERKQWHFEPKMSRGSEDDQIWTINTPLMTALALIQNAPVITRNIVSVILDGLGEGAFIRRPIRALLFEGYSDLIVSVGPLFDRRFANFNGKFAYLYNKNDSLDGHWTVSTGVGDDLAAINKIMRFQSNIVNMTSLSSGQMPQGLNEVKPECAAAWSLDQATNGQLFAPFNADSIDQMRHQQHLQQAVRQQAARTAPDRVAESISKRLFGTGSRTTTEAPDQLVPNPFIRSDLAKVPAGEQPPDLGKYIFYPDLCRPIHLLPSKRPITLANGIVAQRYHIDARVFMNSTQIPTNKCYEMNPRPPLANALAATINSVTGANVAVPNLVASASSPFAMFIPPTHHHHNHEGGIGSHIGAALGGGLFERANHPTSFLNNALHSLGASSSSSPDQQQAASGPNGAPVSRLGRVRQLFSNIVSQRMSAGSPLLPSLTSGTGNVLMGNHFPSSSGRNFPEVPTLLNPMARQSHHLSEASRFAAADGLTQGSSPIGQQAALAGAGVTTMPSSQLGMPGGVQSSASDRWITQFRFKWPRGVFSIGQCQLGAPIYASLPHFLDADEYYLEQVDGLKPNRSLHEFYIDVESTLHSVPVGAKARLQLNVATPELRFRNIPNAMIPVLWQEVTFEIDKPIATMLYWSFTMSATMYKLVSVLLLIGGATLFICSFVGAFRRHRERQNRTNSSVEPSQCSSHSSPTATTNPEHQIEGQRSSWRAHMMRQGSGGCGSGANRPMKHCDELHCGAALNHGFSASVEFHPNDRIDGCAVPSLNSSLASMQSNGASPKQPSSRASSHCELVSSPGTAPNHCAGCLLACLRHSPSAAAPTNCVGQLAYEHLSIANCNHNDSSLVRPNPCRQLPATLANQLDNADKTTLSSTESNLGSCSSIYNQRNRSILR